MHTLKTTTVLIFGTFDIFHKGHINFIAQARAHGDYLIAIIARDKTVIEIKGSLPRNNEKDRLNTLCQSGLVDKAFLGSLCDKYAAIRKYKPDIICLGYDQNHFIDGLRSSLLAARNRKLKKIAENNKSSKIAEEKSKITNLKSKIKIIRLKPYQPHLYKSSLL